MKITEIIEKVNSDKKLKADLMKSEKGNNFRAISESAILDVIDPVLKEAQVYYTVKIKDSHLDIREAYGSKGKKLQFIATLSVQITFYCWDGEILCTTEAVGMGIDDNDKAMGKAYTYAVKYALLKFFRLRYGDDADFEVSKPLYEEKPREEKKEESKEKPAKSAAKEKPMSEAQRDYIIGMMEQKHINDMDVYEKFRVLPHEDDFISMKTAREIIKALENDDFLPF